jgi:hypothetical protein
VKAICQKLLESGVAQEGDAVMAFLHHHLLPVWDLPCSELMVPPGQRKLSFTVDAAAVLNAFNDIGVSALVHGHTHTRSMKRVQGYGKEDDQLTMVLGAGSLGLSHHSCPQHHIQIIEVDGATIRTYDLTCPKTTRNEGRDWSLTKWNTKIARWWDSVRARRAISAMKRNVDLAEADWEIIDSWSRLRAHSDATRWPAERAEIYRLVREVPDGASLTEQEVGRRIQNLLWNPPNWENLTGLTLQEYLAKTDG